MRKLENDEQRKRGCEFCIERTTDTFAYDDGDIIRKRTSPACPHDVCPFTELDRFDRYGDFVKSRGAFYVKRKSGKAGKTK